jgi:Cytochrome c7 and related cytochrome c
MITPRRSQKQIAARFQDNLTQYLKKERVRRALFWITLITIAGGVFAVWSYYKRTPEKFFNPGPVSSHHLNITRAMIGDVPSEELNRRGSSRNCDACHDKSLITGGQLTSRKFTQVIRDSFRAGTASGRIEKIEERCETCHFKLSGHAHTFHEPNAVQFRCSACHQEHRGPGPMKLVASSQCTSCHGDTAIMQAAAQKKVPDHWTPLQRHPQPVQRIVFSEIGRPPEGYTKVFSSFWDDHPEFRINVAKAANPAKIRDPDSYLAADGVHDILRFNHQRHFQPDIPALDKSGKKLDCNYCHELETEGRFMKRISFQAHCQTCHQLQFDLNNPDLTLPHGNSTAVLGFLRSVTTQYEDLARKRGMTDPKKIRSFIEDQRRGLRTQYSSDEQLINTVFFEGDPYKVRPQMARPKAANFAGCAYCHQVKPAAVGAPTIAKPILVDRWMLLSDFDHTKHVAVKGVSCETCHQLARTSSKSADILMPVKESCLQCHSPKAEPGLRTAAECITCHKYHALAAAQIVATTNGETTTASATGPPSLVKAMLLGSDVRSEK